MTDVKIFEGHKKQEVWKCGLEGVASQYFPQA